ncbi:MAG: GAF domain-containing protein [Candidatus Latescibacterota bacterium]
MFPFILGERRKQDSSQDSSDDHPERPADLKDLERHSWRNWFILVGGLFISSIGLGTAFFPLLFDRSFEAWPWSGTNVVLLVAYAFLICIFMSYLTFLQFQLSRLKKISFHKLLEEASQRNNRNTQRLFALFAVSRKMGSETNPQKVFDYMTQACIDTFNCQQASLMLFDKDTQMLVVHSASGHQDKNKVIGKQQKLGEGVAGWAAKYRRPLLLNEGCDVSQYEGLHLNSKSLTAAMVVPILLREELVGVVNVSSRSRYVQYDEEEIRALRVYAENAGTCIRHAEHIEWMRQTIRNLQAKLANSAKNREWKEQPSKG